MTTTDEQAEALLYVILHPRFERLEYVAGALRITIGPRGLGVSWLDKPDRAIREVAKYLRTYDDYSKGMVV